MPDEIPTCLECGKKLRREKFCKEIHGKARYGDYGDGLFCGLKCGYRWGVMNAQREEKERPGWTRIYRAELAKLIAPRKTRECERPALQWEGESFVQIGSTHSVGTQCTGCAKQVEGLLFHYVSKESRVDAFWCQDCVETVKAYQK